MSIRKLLTTGAAFAALACGGGSNAPSATPAPTAGVKLYVVNQTGASISVIDQQRLAVDTVIDLTKMGFSANAKPHHIAVEPNGSAWYVSLIGDGKVLKFGRDNRLLGQVSMETPGLLALDPVHDSLYVGRSMTAVNPPKSLGVIHRTPFTLVDEQEIVIPRPHALVVTRDGRWVHTASLAENRIASVEVSTGRVTLSNIAGAPRSLVQFTIAPDGRTMVAGGELSNTMLAWDPSSAPLTVMREGPVGAKPWDQVYSRDGRRVYASLLADNAVVEIDATTGQVLRRFTERLAQPDGVILRADGRYLFVANRNTGAAAPGMSGHDMHGMEGQSSSNGWLAIIDVASGKTVSTLMLGPSPTGVGAAGAR
jgi:DNA-binding beta-propeller fold protein YncE